MARQPEPVSDVPDAAFRVAPVSRWTHAVTLAVLVAMTAGMASNTWRSWMTATFAALVVMQTINTVQLWRWQVVADDTGIEVQQGLRPPRHVPWGSIVGVRGKLPPTVEIDGEDDLSLGAGIPRKLLHRTAAHIGEHSARHRNTG